MTRRKLKVRDRMVFGRFRTRKSAETNLKLAMGATKKVGGTSTYKLTKSGSPSRPYVITLTRYTQRRK